MKIAYIGISDGLAEPLIKRLGQEGNDVYILSDKAFTKKPGSVFQYRFYRIPRNGDSFEQLLSSVSPDCVIFAGNHYMDSDSDKEYHDDVVLLAQSLKVAAGFENLKFILLSSTDVYGDTVDKADELHEQAPATQRGIRFTQEEQLVEIYRKQYDLNAVVLRASQIYCDRVCEGGEDFLSRNFTDTLNYQGGVFLIPCISRFMYRI